MSVAPDRPPIESDVPVRPDWAPGCDVETLRARAEALAEVRAYFAATGVLEADTPVLGTVTVTDPGIDSIQAIDARDTRRRWFLQTSPEYHMKRLLAAGAPSIYRIGPVFRSDERGRLHNPEFTMIEWYRLGFDLAALIEDVATLVDRLLGPASFDVVTYRALIAQCSGVDPLTAERGALERAVTRLPAPPTHTSDLDERALRDLLFAAALDELGPGRVFVTAFPSDQAALAQCRMDTDGQRVAERFELVIDGIEIANGYHELRDADELSRRMRRDQAARERAGSFVPDADERLLAAMRHGLPPCAGVALGFDRLLMCRLGKSSLADVMPFSIEGS
jgi:elongation factor P--(R)-beta-lysine ligase